MFKRKPKSFRRTLAMAVIKPVVFTGMLAVGVAVGSGYTSQMEEIESVPTKPHSEILAEKFDCWSGEAPKDMAGKFPGHVIVTVGDRTFRAGERYVGMALEHVFGGKHPQINVHYFCR